VKLRQAAVVAFLAGRVWCQETSTNPSTISPGAATKQWPFFVTVDGDVVPHETPYVSPVSARM